ncbi:MAG: undecaprenyl/decaprenyl-phosphate alpha-N-acetylglucosaminyl 1-phosphate transferase [Solirubrobacteraceae bacterium]|nr:undecaprenyl/decaprenyl-phosphate alpha-N-acetylglucosaminyl 1-phosphate transferase [Solirubrobacteraceae bacterium]
MTERDAILAFVVAFVVAVALTPLTARLGRRVGAVDQPRERGLSEHPTPLLGGLAILVAVLVASLIFLDPGVGEDEKTRGILAGAIIVTLVGALDDRFDLPAAVKFIGQIIAATIPVLAGVEVSNITLPFIGAVDLGSAGAPLTVIGIVFVINVVNFSDGVDGLAAGVCAISAVAFSVIAFDLGRGSAAVLAAIIAGSAAGFLVFNFHPAKVFMGDAGSNLLGLLLACVAVEGAVKTQVVLALVFPLLVLAVPFLDTTFVVLKRLKYGRPVYVADQSHFHHRMNRIGFSQRKTVLYLYAWTMLVAGFAVALRFVPYSDGAGQLNLAWSLVLVAVGLVVLAASVYLVYVLEILKFRRLRERRLRRADPQLSEEEVARDVFTKLETGQFDVVNVDEPGATQADP